MMLMMMKLRLKNFKYTRSEAVTEETTSSSSSAPAALRDEEIECEMRPCGMLVQTRSCPSSEVVAAPNLRVRVEYGTARFQISAHSQSTFGELKKLLTPETGLQPGEQKLIFRGKERANSDYLDTCGVKDRSKVVLVDDPVSKQRRLIEMRRNEKIQAVHRSIDDVTMEVDRLVEQVDAIEKSIGNGTKVAELHITTLIEMLMRQAVKLDSIEAAEGNACAKKDLQGKRVQKCVENLDVLKLKVSNAKDKVQPVVLTTKWEIFDPSSSLAHWEFFD